jgi:microcompartment protein CcmL/EutN
MPIGKLNDRKSGNTLVKNGGKGEALGVIETKSFIALVEAVDSGIKASSVISSGWYKVGSSMVSTIFRGDVAAVKTAVSVAARNAERLGELVSSYVIPRPHDFVENIV